VGRGNGLHRGGAMGADQGLTRLFFDGGCGLCRGAVRFVARHDKAGGIRFAPLGGETFERLIPARMRVELPDSMLVLTPEGGLLVQSEAVILLLGRMGPGWRRVGALLAWIPKPLRDAAYRLVARLRPAPRTCELGISRHDERFEP
jgi:predicted DCC family thiol-disulfide oxidoreductase YuxK